MRKPGPRTGIRGFGTGAGRPKGRKNKQTPEQNTAIRQFINNELASLEGIAKKKPALFLRIMSTQTARRAFAMNHLTDKKDLLATIDLTKLSPQDRTDTLLFIRQIRERRRLANMTDDQLCMEHYRKMGLTDHQIIKYGSMIGYDGQEKLAAQLRSQLIPSTPVAPTPERVVELHERMVDAQEKLRQRKLERSEGVTTKRKRMTRVTLTRG